MCSGAAGLASRGRCDPFALQLLSSQGLSPRGLGGQTLGALKGMVQSVAPAAVGAEKELLVARGLCSS